LQFKTNRTRYGLDAYVTRQFVASTKRTNERKTASKGWSVSVNAQQRSSAVAFSP